MVWRYRPPVARLWAAPSGRRKTKDRFYRRGAEGAENQLMNVCDSAISAGSAVRYFTLVEVW